MSVIFYGDASVHIFFAKVALFMGLLFAFTSLLRGESKLSSFKWMVTGVSYVLIWLMTFSVSNYMFSDYSSFYIGVISAASVTSAFCSIVAYRKERNVLGWTAFGFILPTTILILPFVTTPFRTCKECNQEIILDLRYVVVVILTNKKSQSKDWLFYI